MHVDFNSTVDDSNNCSLTCLCAPQIPHSPVVCGFLRGLSVVFVENMKSIVVGLLLLIASASLVTAQGDAPFALGNNFSNNQTTYTVEEGNSQQCVQWGAAPTYGIQYCLTDDSLMGVLQRVDLDATFFLWNLPNGTPVCQTIRGPNPQSVPTFGGGSFVRDAFLNGRKAKLYKEAIGSHVASTFVEDGSNGPNAVGHLLLINNFLSTSYTSRTLNATNLDVFQPPSYCDVNGELEWVPEAKALFRRSHVYRRSGGSAVMFPTPELVRQRDPARRPHQRSWKADVRQKLIPQNATIPTAFDNRKFATPVRNDAGCWSGWAFATAAALEVIYYSRQSGIGQLGVESWFSVQQILDCTGWNTVADPYANRGCYHGNPSDAYATIANDGALAMSINKEPSYPYTAVGGYMCRNANASSEASKHSLRLPFNISAVNGPEPMSVQHIQTAIMNTGAVVALMTDSATVNYPGLGHVYNNTNCPKGTSHAVAILGWGYDEPSGLDFWIAKNSWGSNWGEQGYLRIVRGSDMCGIESNIITLTLDQQH